MKSIYAHILSLNEDPSTVKIEATLQHIQSGEKEHYSGKPVQEMQPVISSMVFRGQAGNDLFEFKNEGKRLDNAETYWSQLEVPSSISPKEAANLMTGMIDHHRTLTNTLHSTYSKIERDPRIIASVLNQKEQMHIDFVPLARYTELDDEIFSTIMEITKTPQRRDEILKMEFERFQFTADYKEKPCHIDLFKGLVQEYREGTHTGLGFNNYYNWYHKSAEMFDEVGRVKEDAKIGFARAIAAWTTAGGEPTQEWIQDKQYWARRNFEVHPRHEETINNFVKDVALEYLAAAKPKAKASI